MKRIMTAAGLLAAMTFLVVGCAFAEPNYDRIPNQMQQNTIFHSGANYSMIRCGNCGATFEYGRFERCPRCGNFFGGTTNETYPSQTNRVIHGMPYYFPYPGEYYGPGQPDHRPFPDRYNGQGGNGGASEMERLLLELLRKAAGK